jgi:hypothetical protein
MADTGKNVFNDEMDPSSILVKEYLMKHIYCSNKFKDFTTKLDPLLERIKNFAIKALVGNMYDNMKFLVDKLKDIENNDNLLTEYVKNIGELYKLSTDFENILLFYSYQ